MYPTTPTTYFAEPTAHYTTLSEYETYNFQDGLMVCIVLAPVMRCKCVIFTHSECFFEGKALPLVWYANFAEAVFSVLHH